MISLAATILVLIAVYFIQQGHPWLAGFAAVIPVKIIGTSLMTFEGGGMSRLTEAASGMFVGQMIWLVALGILLLVLKT